jgi:hypothetical protein
MHPLFQSFEFIAKLQSGNEHVAAAPSDLARLNPIGQPPLADGK